MIIAQNVPTFLWEYAVAHGMYLRNRVYHKCEFGTPVWVLLQGQDKPPKLQPRSKQRIYVGSLEISASLISPKKKFLRNSWLFNRNPLYRVRGRWERTREQLMEEVNLQESYELQLVLITGIWITRSVADLSLGDKDPVTLREARESPNWSEWENAIHVELDQLNTMGTWKLVNCPKEAVPIANKWVFDQDMTTRILFLR